MSKFAKIFSIPHNDILKTVMDGPNDFLRYDVRPEDDENFFYTIIDNDHQSFRDEVTDIFFAKSFKYKFKKSLRRYGDVMCKEATDKQVDNLFKIQ